VIDAGAPRNRCSAELHGFLTRDGTAPAEFLELGRRELERYGTVGYRAGRVTEAAPTPDGFRATLEGGESLDARTILIATGVVDRLPDVEGIDRFYGVSVHHCPYCDGWEHRDRRLAVYGCDARAIGFALELRQWSRDLVWCSDGHAPAADARATAERHGVRLRTEPIARLEGDSGRLARVVFRDGPPEPADALFFCTGQRQHSDLARRLGCRFNDRGTVQTRAAEGTNVPGVWVAGDASKDAQMVVVAAAEGAEAAIAINAELTRRDLEAERSSSGAPVT
jgi:thioredoxin reductase